MTGKLTVAILLVMKHTLLSLRMMGVAYPGFFFFRC